MAEQRTIEVAGKSVRLLVGGSGPPLLYLHSLGGDVGELLTWSLLIQFEGDVALDERGKTSEPRLQIPITGNVSGASGTKFVSDVRLYNRGSSPVEATLIYTPSGKDGSAE